MPRNLITPAAPRGPQPPVKPKGLGRRAKLGKLTRPSIRGTGPRYLKLYALPKQGADWCTPPPNFVGAHTSASEWLIYAAASKIMGNDPPDPRKPPYVGGTNWTYQDPLLGGRMTKGGQVCDFVFQLGTDEVCVRLQSWFFHIVSEISKRVDELFEKTHSTARIVDIFEPDFVGDCTLEAACRVLANAIAGRGAPDPALAGTAEPARVRGGTR